MLSAREERKVSYYGKHSNIHQSHSQNASGDLRGVAGGDGVTCVIAPPIHLGAWSILLYAVMKN